MADAGRFDKRITFERATIEVGDVGGSTSTWTAIASCWAWIKSSGGSKITEADQLIPSHTWSIKVRARKDVTAKDRIIYGSKVLYITSVSDDSARAAYTEFLCTEFQQ